MKLTLRTRKLVGLLTGIVAALAVLAVAGHLVSAVARHGHVARVARLFHLDSEWNVAAWYSALALLLCAVLLALIATSVRRAGEPFARRWTALAVIFAYLAVDEGVGLHELASLPAQRLLGTSGWLRFAWVIPAVPLLAVLVVVYRPFLLHLPRAVAIQFVVAGTIYVGGAIGMELVSAMVLTARTAESWPYQLVAGVEELMEMGAVVLFVHVLLQVLAAREPELRVEIRR